LLRKLMISSSAPVAFCAIASGACMKLE
jgi:hypothetical protein